MRFSHAVAYIFMTFSFGALAKYIAEGIGQRELGKMIKLVTIVSIIVVAWEQLIKVINFGVGMVDKVVNAINFLATQLGRLNPFSVIIPAAVIITTLAFPEPARAEASNLSKVLYKTFVSGPGIAIVSLLFLAVAATIAKYITGAMGQGQIGNMIQVVAIFAGIAVLIGVVSTGLYKFMKLIGMM